MHCASPFVACSVDVALRIKLFRVIVCDPSDLCKYIYNIAVGQAALCTRLGVTVGSPLWPDLSKSQTPLLLGIWFRKLLCQCLGNVEPGLRETMITYLLCPLP